MKGIDTLQIRHMKITDLSAASAWAEKEGWNPICFAENAYYATDPHGFFLLQNQGDTIATISKVKYNQGLAFVGFYMVDPLHRGHGYGKYLWDKVTEDLNHYTYVGLDGVVAQVNNYQVSGFEFYTTTSRYCQDIREHRKGQVSLPSSIMLSTDFDMAELVAYDQAVFSQERANFLNHWFQLPAAKTLTAYDKQKQCICGYGQLVKAAVGYRISPLFADTVDIAIYLYDKLCQFAPENMSIYIDIPDNLEFTKALVDTFRLKKISETARMYYQGRQPQRLSHKEFGRTTLELG